MANLCRKSAKELALEKKNSIKITDKNIEKYFNKNAFINCNGLSFDEILEKIKEIDNDDEKYYNMLNSHPFLENINFVEYYNNRYVKFLKNILKENNYEITI